MKVLSVLRKSAVTYGKNFVDLMGAFLVELVLRGICLVPLMFLLSPEISWLAWLCIPLYVLIALPARQNYAIALQDMLHGGRVFSPRLVSFDGYFRKLGRGLLGTLKMALWLALPVLAVLLMVQVYKGQGPLVSLTMAHWEIKDVGGATVMERFRILSSGKIDGFTMMRWFQMMGGDAVGGLINLILVLAPTFLLPVIGCAVHCGHRHAAALEDKKLLRGKRLRMVVLWFLGLLVFLPFVAVVGYMLGSDLKAFVMGFAEMFLSKSFTVGALGDRLYILAAAFVVLFLTVAPLKQLIPAVAAHEQMQTVYKEIKTDAAP